MSGLIKFKFGFENHLKIYFEKLEKEKEKRNSFHLVFGPSRPALARGPLTPASRSRVGRAQARPAGPTRARCFTESLTNRARLSASPSTFLSSSSGRTPPSLSSPIRIDLQSFLSFASLRHRAIKTEPRASPLLIEPLKP
jgi:hypothetical protein